jgi:hypothetical protein
MISVNGIRVEYQLGLERGTKPEQVEAAMGWEKEVVEVMAMVVQVLD